MTSLDCVSNGINTWSATLPQRVESGQTLKLHVFVDGSTADIFVCDRWAFSVRLFPLTVTVNGDMPRGLHHIERRVTVGDTTFTVTFDVLIY